MTPLQQIEHDDLISHLRANGFGPLLDILQDEENYFKSTGKKCMSKIARQLNLKMAQLEKMFEDVRKIAEEFEE